MSKIDRMKELIETLDDLNYKYYTLDEPSVSDKEYDNLYDELISLEKDTNTVLENSPTQRVGGEILDKFVKHKHLGNLWSNKQLSKTYTKMYTSTLLCFRITYSSLHS